MARRLPLLIAGIALLVAPAAAAVHHHHDHSAPDDDRCAVCQLANTSAVVPVPQPEPDFILPRTSPIVPPPFAAPTSAAPVPYLSRAPPSTTT